MENNNGKKNQKIKITTLNEHILTHANAAEEKKIKLRQRIVYINLNI